MSFKQIREYVPVFYHKFLPPFFEKEIPAEAFTNCENCPMIASSREEMKKEVSKPFAPDTKCCTFIPKLPNYFVGGFLQDSETLLARKLLLQRIAGKRGVFPQGLYPDKKYRLLYEFGSKQGFGKSRKMQCPYYLQGEYNCSLWKYRESICATWFCKHLAGDAGRDFWDGMRDLFKMMQEKFLEYTMLKLELNIVPAFGENENLSFEDIEELPMNDKDYKMRWQQWEGREEEFYLKCFDIIRGLHAAEFNDILGDTYQTSLVSLEEKHQIAVSLPDVLKLNPDLKFEQVILGRYRLQLRSYIDRNDTVITYAFDLPTPVIDVFRKEQDVAHVLNILNEKYDIELGKDILLTLFHHGILNKVDSK